MSDGVRIDPATGIATVRVAPLAAGAVGAAARAVLIDALRRIEAAPEARVTILIAAGDPWSPPNRPDDSEASPRLQDLTRVIAEARKPVIAAFESAVSGAALEVAIAATTRVVAPDAGFAMPQVLLGVVPHGGGTQRLPRLVGAEAALKLMLSGRTLTAARAKAIGLVDVVVEDNVEAGATRLARAYLSGKAKFPTAEERAARHRAADWLTAVTAARRSMAAQNLRAPGRIVDCVEAALLLPEEEGLEFELAAYGDLVTTRQARALRHIAQAEARALSPPRTNELSPALAADCPEEIGMLGVSPAGSGLATALLGGGCQVMLIAEDGDMLARGLSRVATHHEEAVRRGRLAAEARDAEWDRIAGSTDKALLRNVDLVIEAGTEPEEVRTARVAELSELLRAARGPGADLPALAVLTSEPNVTRFAKVWDAPDAVLGLHVFPPAYSGKLVELVTSEGTAPRARAQVRALMRRLGRYPVEVGNAAGFVGLRMLGAYRDAAALVVSAGVSPYRIDRAMKGFGFPLGPFHVSDIGGLDQPSGGEEAGPAERLRAALLKEGRRGQRAGRGVYLYPDGARRGDEDPALDAALAALFPGYEDGKAAMTEAGIQRRISAALANAGAALLEAGVVADPASIDLIMVHGFGYPRWRGGPMHHADAEGLLQFRDDLRRFAAEDAFWTPVELWSDLIKNGRRFGALSTPQ